MAKSATFTSIKPAANGGVTATSSDVTIKKTSKMGLLEKLKKDKQQQQVVAVFGVALMVGLGYYMYNKKKKKDEQEQIEAEVAGARKAIKAMF